MSELMETLSKMDPHYIRCIKPNQKQVPLEFENGNVLQQLRCGGVLEAVRISCQGYPTKLRYDCCGGGRREFVACGLWGVGVGCSVGRGLCKVGGL